ncbi:MAG: sigma 54 modulation/S30EA ribosomal C-terminal domain-containing protein, partial [Gaiellales bacterium]
FARVRLRRDADPALQRPAIAKASLDVNGRLVRAHVAAAGMHEAIDILEERMRRRLDELARRDEGRYHETGEASEGEWRHGDLPTQRPEFFPRPADERRIIRHKTPPLGAMTPERAALEMMLLDHDFLLFLDAESGREAVVYRATEGAGELRLIRSQAVAEQAAAGLPVDQPPPRLSVAQAVERLNVSGDRFVFFVDMESHEGALLYRRYDGHYGLITRGGALTEQPDVASLDRAGG